MAKCENCKKYEDCRTGSGLLIAFEIETKELTAQMNVKADKVIVTNEPTDKDKEEPV